MLSGEVAAAAGRDALAVLTVAPKPDLGRQLSQENQDLDGAGDREGEGVVAARADPVAASRLAPPEIERHEATKRRLEQFLHDLA